MKVYLFIYSLMLLCLSLCYADNIMMDDITPPGNLNKYASPSYGTVECSFIYYLSFTELDNAGFITISASTTPITFPSYTLLSSTSNNFVFELIVSGLTSTSSQIEITANNNVGFTKQFYLPNSCIDPPTTLDIQFLNNTLYENYDPFLYGPTAVFRVNNFLLEGPTLDVTTNDNALMIGEVKLLEKNIYTIHFRYGVGELWANILLDKSITIKYPGSTWAPEVNVDLKPNFKGDNQVTINSFDIHPLFNGIVTYPKFFSTLSYTATKDTGFPVTYLSASVTQRLVPALGNWTNGIFLNGYNAMTGSFTLKSQVLSFAAPVITPMTIDIVIPNPNYVTTLVTNTASTNVLICEVDTNKLFREFTLTTPQYQTIKSPPHPYGMTAGNGLQYKRRDDYFISPFANGEFAFGYGTPSINYLYTNPNGDSNPPNIISIETSMIGDIILYRVHITDDKSGFGNFGQMGDYRNLVIGSLTDGFYEFHIDLSKTTQFMSNLQLCDQVKNCKSINVNDFIASDWGTFKPNFEFKGISDINRIYWKYNDIDVSQKGVDNILYICSTINTLYPHLLNSTSLMNVGMPSDFIDTSTLGRYNSALGCYEFPFRIDKNYMTGTANYHLKFGMELIQSPFLEIYFGYESQLRIKSINGDRLGPLISKIDLIPGNGITIDGNGATLSWNITIKDDYNGFKKGRIVIINDLGLVKYNFDLNPSLNGYLIDGDQFNGVYHLSIDVDGRCKSQKYFIYSVELEDMAGHLSNFYQDNVPISLLVNPMIYILGDVDTLSSILVNCEHPPIDVDPPDMTLFDFEPSTIATTASELVNGVSPRLVTFTFTVTDVEGILKEALPIIYLHDQNFNVIQKTANLTLYATTQATYKCEFEVPFGFGYTNGIKVSVFNMVDFQSNVRGYSIGQLESNGFPNTISVENTLSLDISIISVSPIYDVTHKFIVQGLNFETNDRLRIENDFESYEIPSGVGYSSIMEFKNIINLSGTTVNVTVVREVSVGVFKYSNTLIVPVIKKPTPSGSSSDSGSTSSNSNSNSGSTSSNSNGSNSDGNSNSDSSMSPNVPQECLNKCSGDNGQCTPNGCVCKSPWIGLDCSSQVIIINPSIDPSSPTTNITIPTIDGNNNNNILYSIISIVQLNELNNGKIINQYPFTKWIASKNLNSKYSQFTSTSFIYTTDIINKLDQSITTLNVSIDYFGDIKEPVNITFANEILTMNPYSLKYSVNMSHYSFSSSLNTLQLILSASLELTSDDSECSSIQIGNTVESESEFIKMQVDDHSLYGRFIKRGIVDGRIRQITNTFLDSQYQSLSTPSKVQTHIGINIPHYQKTIQLDPDFSVLVDNRPASSNSPNSICTPKKSKLSGAQIAGIVIGAVGLVSIVVISIVYYFYKKKQQSIFIQNMNHKLEAMNKA